MAKKVIKLEYKGELYARLEDGTYENLYYGNNKAHRRNFYREKSGKWYLDCDRVYGCAIAYCHLRIVEFLDKISEEGAK